MPDETEGPCTGVNDDFDPELDEMAADYEAEEINAKEGSA